MSIEEIPVEVLGSINNSVTSITANNAASSTRRSRIIPQRPLLDINKCDSASLEALPGIGPVLSARIIKYRKLLGGFAATDQLREVYGLTEETFNLISGRIFADTTVIKRLNINTADYKQLIRLPYFERYEVIAILKYRELNGKIFSMSDLVKNKLIVPETAIKVRSYLEFDE